MYAESESITLAVHESVAELLSLMDQKLWPSIQLVADLKGPRGSYRYRFIWPRPVLISAMDMAENMVPTIKQEERHHYAAAASRSLRRFTRDARQALGMEEE